LEEVEAPMKKSLLTLVVLLGLALPVAAQLATGNIYGTVTDESGRPFPEPSFPSRESTAVPAPRPDPMAASEC